MKLFNITAIALACLVSTNVMAASCYTDQGQMRDQINVYDSITTTNWVQVQWVDYTSETSNNECSATCSSYYQPMTCTWVKGNWGNTLVAR